MATFHAAAFFLGLQKRFSYTNEAKKAEQADALNHHAFGTFGTSAAEQPLVPKASGGK